MSRKIVEYFLFGNLSKEYVNFVKIWKRNQRNFSPILERNIFGWNCFFLSMASGAESVQNWARDVLVSCKIEFLKNNKTICPKLNWKRTHFKHNNSGEKQNLSLHFPLIAYSLELMDGISLKFKFMRHSPIGCCNKISHVSFIREPAQVQVIQSYIIWTGPSLNFSVTYKSDQHPNFWPPTDFWAKRNY